MRPVYQLARSWGYEDGAWNQEAREASTRSGQRKLGITAADRGLGKDGAQVGYGEITMGGANMLLKVFSELATGKLTRIPLPGLLTTEQQQACLLSSSSRFLDIGSGLGKLVLHMTLATGCFAAGVEIVSNRVKLAVEFRDKLVEKKKVPAWVAQTTSFVAANAATEKGPLLVNGAHATHIYMFSVVFSDHDIGLLAARLNKTDFKVLICALKHRHEKTLFKLTNAFQAVPVEVSMTGGGQHFKMCVFIKLGAH